MAADITIQELESVFGKPLLDQLTGANESLDKIQKLLGSKKLDALESMSNKFKAMSDFITGLKQPKEVKEANPKEVKAPAVSRETTKDDKDKKSSNGIFDIEAVTSSKVIGGSTKILPVRVVEDPKKRTAVDVYIPPETRVWIENLIGDTVKDVFDIAEEKDRAKKKDTKKEDKKEDKKNWWDKLLAGLMGGGLIASLLGKILSPLKLLSKIILGPFKWLAKELLHLLPLVLKETGKLVMPIIRGLLGAVGPLLAGAGLAIAGIATLLSGLKDSGPYKGLKKLIGKGLLASGAALIKKEFTKLGKLVLDAAKSLTKGGFVRNFVAATTKGFRNIFRTIEKLPGKIFSGATKALKSLFSGITGKAVGAVAKGGGKGLIARLASTAGGFFLKGLKRLPLIGTLIGIGFAVSRIMKGDFVGGLLDLASAAAAAVPVVGTALSIAIDLFSAYRDTKTGGSEKAGKANMGWINNAKKWIGDNIRYVPVIGPLIDMAKAISDGNYLDALGYLAKAAIPPLGIVVDLLQSKAGQETVAKGIDFMADISKWVSDKVKNIPYLRSLAGAGEALFTGKGWFEVLKALGQDFTPFKVIADLLESTNADANAATAATGAPKESMTDTLFKAILNMVPDVSLFGWSLKEWVAGQLGLKYDSKTKTASVAPKSPEAPKTSEVPESAAKVANLPETKKKESHWYNPLSWGSDNKESNNTSTPVQSTNNTQTQESQQPLVQSTNDTSTQTSQQASIQPTDNKQTPTATIQPTETPAVPKDEAPASDDAAGNMSDMSDSLNEHSTLLKGLIEYQKQTAANTKALIAALKSQNPASNAVVTNVNSPTNIVSGPGTSSMFRMGVLQR